MQKLHCSRQSWRPYLLGGSEQATRVVSARRELLTEALADGTADRDPEVTALLTRLARELCGEPPTATAA